MTAAELCGQLKLTNVALIEKEAEIGGECLHTGCVPSKALLHSAKSFCSSDGHGDRDPWSHVRDSIKKIQADRDNDASFESHGITVLHGEARFIDPHIVKLSSGKTITSKFFLLATGSHPRVPAIDGLDSVPFYTNESVFSLDTTPRSITIVGAGPIGCELATAFAMLGSTVHLVQRGPDILPRDDPAARKLVQKKLQDLGVHIYSRTETVSVTKRTSEIQLLICDAKDKSAQSVLKSDTLLVATGRVPNTELDLQGAGVVYGDAGITIDKKMQTSQSHIFAVGDCTPSPKFTHLAAHQAGKALTNMFTPRPLRSNAQLDTIPWITYTSPEVGQIGLTEEQANKQQVEYTVEQLDLAEIDRAITDNDQGFIKVLLNKKRRIIGATVVSDNASEALSLLTHMYYHKQSLSSLLKTVIPYPTIASGLSIMASKNVTDQVANSVFSNLLFNKWRK